MKYCILFIVVTQKDIVNYIIPELSNPNANCYKIDFVINKILITAFSVRRLITYRYSSKAYTLENIV